jgi:hypothetical protein
MPTSYADESPHGFDTLNPSRTAIAINTSSTHSPRSLKVLNPLHLAIFRPHFCFVILSEVGSPEGDPTQSKDPYSQAMSPGVGSSISKEKARPMGRASFS